MFIFSIFNSQGELGKHGLKIYKKNLIVCLSYIIGYVHLNKNISYLFLCKYKHKHGPSKLKNHAVSCWKKCVSFKDIYVLRNGLTLIMICLFW